MSEHQYDEYGDCFSWCPACKSQKVSPMSDTPRSTEQLAQALEEWKGDLEPGTYDARLLREAAARLREQDLMPKDTRTQAREFWVELSDLLYDEATDPGGDTALPRFDLPEDSDLMSKVVQIIQRHLAAARAEGAREAQQQNERVLRLARDMAGYIHHSGYPVYDGGHTEPEETCKHPDCEAVR